MRRTVRVASVLVLALAGSGGLVGARPASSAVSSCPDGLKLVAGACVRSCPGGYEDRGRICVYRNQSR